MCSRKSVNIYGVNELLELCTRSLNEFTILLKTIIETLQLAGPHSRPCGGEEKVLHNGGIIRGDHPAAWGPFFATTKVRQMATFICSDIKGQQNRLNKK